jgi:hypothetical protein
MQNCEVVTLQQVIGQEGSAIVGGSLTAGDGIEVFELGAESFPITDATLGGTVYCSIRLREIEHEIEAAESNVKRIAYALKPLTSISSEPISPAKRHLMETLMDQKRELEQFIRSLHSERRARQMAHPEQAGGIRVTGRMHAGCRLCLYGARLDVRQRESRVEFQRSADGKSVVTMPFDSGVGQGSKAA